MGRAVEIWEGRNGQRQRDGQSWLDGGRDYIQRQQIGTDGERDDRQ